MRKKRSWPIAVAVCVKGAFMMNEVSDVVLPFYLTGEGATAPRIRGRIARLFHAQDAILSRHDYPDIVAGLCAETMALTSVLSSMMSFEGVFTVQAKGDGAVKTLMSDMTQDGDMRCYAAFGDDEMLQSAYQGPALLPRLAGSGYMAFTVDHQVTKRRYQGIVELDGPHLGDAATAWYKNSEQLSTLVMTIAEKTADGWVSSALLLQQIAISGGKNDEDDLYKQPEELDAESLDLWHTAMTLCSSVKTDELLDKNLPLADLVYRLFNSLGPHIQPTRPITDKCRCSPQKVEVMLDGLSEEQRASLADENGQLVVSCEFCKTDRTFDLTAL